MRFRRNSTLRITFLSLGVILLLFSLGCSYFNAFYNTNRTFEEGERERERSTDPNVRPSGYTQCVEAGGKLIEFYPESKYLPEALFLMGQSHYWLRDYHKAKRKFEELISNYPGGPLEVEARLWLGRCLVALKQRQPATTTLRGLIAETDDPEIVSGALFALAELYYLDSLYHQAAERFSEISNSTDNPEMLGESYWRAGDAAFRDRNFSGAVEYFREALRYDLTRSLRFQTQLWLGRALYELAQYNEAKSIFEDLLDDNRFFEEHPPVRVELARCHYALGDMEEAIELLEQVAEMNERTEIASRAFYEKAIILLDQPGMRVDAQDALSEARVARARSPYALRADTLFERLERVDELGLERSRLQTRIDLTEDWLLEPVNPADTEAFYATAYYDSMLIDSLQLVLLWEEAWRDSVILPELPEVEAIDSTSLAPDSVAAPADSSVLSAVATDSMSIADSASTADSTLTVNITTPEQLDSLYAARRAESHPDSEEAGDNGGRPLRVPVAWQTPAESEGTEPDPFGEIAPGFEQMMEEGEEIPGMIDSAGQVSEAPEVTETQPVPDDQPDLAEANSSPALQSEVETITIFDLTPVLDSLAHMKADLQDTRFQLAEILLFDLQEPDSAILLFNELSRPPNADTVQARASMALAYIAESALEETRRDSLLQYIANTYAETRFGRFAMGMLGIDLPEEPVGQDEVAFREAEDLWFAEGSDAQDAYTRYRWIADTYPASNYSPQAMFAAAFIAADRLEDNETAEELFNEIIERYPGTDQAVNAGNILDQWMQLQTMSTETDSGGFAEMESDIEAILEEDVETAPFIIGGLETLGRVLELRDLLPPEIINGTGGEVLIRYVVNEEGDALDFRVLAEDPPGRGLARGLIAGLEDVSFSPGRLEGVDVATRIERRYTLPLDAPPNVRPLPRRRR